MYCTNYYLFKFSLFINLPLRSTLYIIATTPTIIANMTDHKHKNNNKIINKFNIRLSK